MYQLIPQLDRIPRTTTRSEWQAIWRWKRVTQREINAYWKKHQAILDQHVTKTLIYGSSAMLIEDMINPPVLIYPNLLENNQVDLRPGAINYAK